MHTKINDSFLFIQFCCSESSEAIKFIGQYQYSGQFNGSSFYIQIENYDMLPRYFYKDEKKHWRAGYLLGSEERSYIYNLDTRDDLPLTGWKRAMKITKKLLQVENIDTKSAIKDIKFLLTLLNTSTQLMKWRNR